MRLPASLFATLSLTLLAACSAQPPPRTAPPALQASQRPEMLLRLGDDMLRNGDLMGALNLYRAAALAEPRNPAPLLRMAMR